MASYLYTVGNTKFDLRLKMSEIVGILKGENKIFKNVVVMRMGIHIWIIGNLVETFLGFLRLSNKHRDIVSD